MFFRRNNYLPYMSNVAFQINARISKKTKKCNRIKKIHITYYKLEVLFIRMHGQ